MNYRMLTVGEVIQEGDEWWSYSGIGPTPPDWVPATEKTIGTGVTRQQVGYFRRPEPEPAEVQAPLAAPNCPYCHGEGVTGGIDMRPCVCTQRNRPAVVQSLPLAATPTLEERARQVASEAFDYDETPINFDAHYEVVLTALRSVTEQSVKDFASAILHGDNDHREWLTKAAEAFTQGEPLPTVNGKSLADTLAARVAELEKELAELHNTEEQRRRSFTL